MDSSRLQYSLGKIHAMGILLQTEKKLLCSCRAINERGMERFQAGQVVAMDMAKEARQ